MEERRVLVTGGAGFIGSHVADALIRQGYDVAIVDNLSSGQRRNVNPKARLYQVDIRDAGALADVFDKERPHFVDHHAAQISVTASVRDPLFDAQVNILGTLNLLEVSRKIGVRKFVFASTGGALFGEPEQLPCHEESPINPLSPYGAAKRSVEIYLHFYQAAYGLRYTALRYANVYGPRQDPFGEAGVVAIFSERMLRGDDVFIFGDGSAQRDYVYVDDVAAANLLAMEKGDGQKYNIGWGVGTSVNELFQAMKDLTGYPKAPVHKPPRAGDVQRVYLDSAKARRELGWRPAVELKQGLAKTIEFFRGLQKSS